MQTHAATMTDFTEDPALYIFTSLTAGSSHIVTATSRLETILRANRIPFKAIDIATDEGARRTWKRRAGKDEGGRLRKLPGLVQEGWVVGVSEFYFLTGPFPGIGPFPVGTGELSLCGLYHRLARLLGDSDGRFNKCGVSSC